MSAIRTFKNDQIHWVWNHSSAQLRDELIAFWSSNKALPASFETWRRTFEVACVVRDSAGQIVGVSSVYAGTLGNTTTPYWFYRTFIREDRRDVGLAPRVFAMTFEQLQQVSAKEPWAPVGVIVITENPKLETPAGVRIIERSGLQRLGLDGNGQSVWHRLFGEGGQHD